MDRAGTNAHQSSQEQYRPDSMAHGMPRESAPPPYVDVTEGQGQSFQQTEKPHAEKLRQSEEMQVSSSSDSPQTHDTESKKGFGKLREWKKEKTEEFRAWQATKPRAEQPTTEQLNYYSNIWQSEAPGGRDGKQVVYPAEK